MLRLLTVRLLTVMTCLAFGGPALAQDNPGTRPDAWLQELLDKAARQAETLRREGWEGRAAGAAPVRPRETPPVLAFVSFSMPEKVLLAVLEQTARAGGVTVLRGLVNDSFRDTAEAVAAIAREHGPGFSVDPRLFAEYGIEAVPSFVVPGPVSADKVAGNLSLAAALEAMARDGDNRETAKRLLARLRKRE